MDAINDGTGSFRPRHYTVSLLSGAVDSGVRAVVRTNPTSTDFLAAAVVGDIDVVQSYIASGLDRNVTDNLGRTAVMLTARYGHAALLRTLLTAGADLDIRDAQGRTVSDYFRVFGLFSEESRRTRRVTFIRHRMLQIGRRDRLVSSAESDTTTADV